MSGIEEQDDFGAQVDAMLNAFAAELGTPSEWADTAIRLLKTNVKEGASGFATVPVAALHVLLSHVEDMEARLGIIDAPPPKIESRPEYRFLVWKKNGRVPRRRHATIEAARAEAVRLAEKNPDSKFRVLEELEHAIGRRHPEFGA